MKDGQFRWWRVARTVNTSGTRLTVAAAAGLALIASTPAGAPAGVRSGVPVQTAAAAPSAVPAPIRVTLPTGDKLAVATSDGRQEASLLPGSPDRLLTQFQLGGDLYVVPEATIKNGGGLDMSRFDVTRLAAGTAGTAPAGSAAPQDGPFKLHTLTVNGIDDAGQPDQSDAALVVNLTDTRLFSVVEPFFQGQFKVSVPGGEYALVSFFYTAQTRTARVVALPQVSVTADQTVTLDARSATTPITVSTPRPASPVEEEVSVDLAATAFGNAEYSLLDFSGQQLSWYAAPTSPVTVGTLHYYVYDRLNSPAGVAPAYSYALEFPADGAIPARQAYSVTPDQLAAQDTSYYAPGHSQTSLETRFSFLPWESVNFRADSVLTRPLRRTEYYTGDPGITWQTSLFAYENPDTHAIADQFFDSYHVYRAGERTQVSWLAGPLREGTEHYEPTPQAFACPACREAGKLNFFIWPFGDNGVGHASFPGPSDDASYTLDENGQTIASGNGMLAGLFTVPEEAATYTLDYDVTRAETWWTQSTSIQTRWTFRSASQSGPAPNGWECLDGSTDCTPIPLLSAGYDLPSGMLGQEHPGPTAFRLRIGHFQDAGSPAVTGASAATSFDGGATWTSARVSGLSGNYLVSYVNPPADATDGYVAIRVSARDAAGGELTQTVLNAYAITP